MARHRMEADATLLNEQLMKLRDIYLTYSGSPFAKGETIDQRNDWLKNGYLEVISMYPSSYLSYHYLNIHLINGLRDYENRVAIKEAIDRLDSNYIKPHLIKSLHKKYSNMILKNQDKTNMAFPAVALHRADGEATSVERLRKTSDLLFIDFWATWCGPCIKQQPLFAKVKDNFKDRDHVKFLSISLDKKKTDWDTYSQKHVFTYESYWVDQIVHADFTAQLGIQSIPRYMLVDSKTGTIIKPRVSIEALQAEIEAFLSDKKTAITAL